MGYPESMPTLTPEQKEEALRLFRKEHKSMRAIARALGSNGHTVKAALLEARAYNGTRDAIGRRRSEQLNPMTNKLIALPTAHFVALTELARQRNAPNLREYIRGMVRRELESAGMQA
jgi:transposase-like protein